MSKYLYNGARKRQDVITIYYLEDAELFRIYPIYEKDGSPMKRYIAVYRAGDRDFHIVTKLQNPQPFYTGHIFGIDQYNTHALYGAPLVSSDAIPKVFEDESEVM